MPTRPPPPLLLHLSLADPRPLVLPLLLLHAHMKNIIKCFKVRDSQHWALQSLAGMKSVISVADVQFSFVLGPAKLRLWESITSTLSLSSYHTVLKSLVRVGVYKMFAVHSISYPIMCHDRPGKPGIATGMHFCSPCFTPSLIALVESRAMMRVSLQTFHGHFCMTLTFFFCAAADTVPGEGSKGALFVRTQHRMTGLVTRPTV